jgi:predicted RNA-binding protein with PUA-like domain
VPLAAIKASPALAQMAMLTQFRLSVSPVTDGEWATIMALSGGR